ncbi:histidine--tRNA ligase [candidate division WWE3 bacterium]|uniref:Histidine--tRNA ligase n=1 Tax=candidate division WWE3 bacterium TaxID=2053526 RepID=A0A955J1D2_UNCKA|nr:histidine--tRNA ligase [candidate division WWE3 bacterium]
MENTLSTQSYKGARDFYPEDMQIQNYIYDTWKKVCKRYGYQEYSFPILEPWEIFAAKSGAEIVNEQLFAFEDQGGRKLAMRPELTPGTVRMLAANYKELVRPVRWFMIGNNWRYEKPQLGRGREFYQLEVNIFGVPEVTGDFETLQIAIDIMREFGANSDMFEIKISDRRLISALLIDTLGLSEETATKVRRTMDKRAKLSKEEFLHMLDDLGIVNVAAQKIEAFMNATIEELPNIIEDVQNNKGYQTITQLFTLLQNANLEEYASFDSSIIRGFDYSDGLVYEVFDKNPTNKRSMFGGERFDKLISIFGNSLELEATGYAMGDVTLKEFLKGWNLLPKVQGTCEYLVTVWPEQDSKYITTSFAVADKLRSQGYSAQSWLDANAKLDKQLKYADKNGVKKVVIIGPEELNKGIMLIKNMETGTQEEVQL